MSREINWHRVLWIATFTLLVYTSNLDGCRDTSSRHLIKCDPLHLETCAP